jgi:hypothetical protein
MEEEVSRSPTAGQATEALVHAEHPAAQAEGAGAEASPAQVRAAAMLVEMLRARYRISAVNCVTHAQVSLNPSNMRVGYHMDWASKFPFEQLVKQLLTHQRHRLIQLLSHPVHLVLPHPGSVYLALEPLDRRDQFRRRYRLLQVLAHTMLQRFLRVGELVVAAQDCHHRAWQRGL